MTFHIKEKLSRTIGFFIFYLALIAFCLYAGAKGENVQEFRIILILLFAFGGIAYLFKNPKETVIEIRDKTITVTDVFRSGKNKKSIRSVAYGDIIKIESRSHSSRYKNSGHYLYLRTGGTVRLPCGIDKGLDNFITNNLVTELCAADPLFKAVRDEQNANDKETNKALITLLFVSILLAGVCWLITANFAGADPGFFFSLWILGVFLSFMILLVISCTKDTARQKKQIAELRAKDPQFDAAYVKQAAAQKEEQKRVDKLIIKVSLFCLLLGYAASFLGYLIGMANMKDALGMGFFLGILFFLAFALIRGNLKNKN